MPSHLVTIFWLIFHHFLPPTSIPWTLKIIVFPKEKQGFFKKSLFEVGNDFWSIFVPTCIHFASKNPWKFVQKSIPRCMGFLIDFCFGFSSILLRFWKPTWSHVGHFFAQNTATANAPRVVFVVSIFFFGFWAALAPSRSHFGSILDGSGLHFGSFWRSFPYFGKIWGTFVGTVLASCSKHF